MSRTGIEIEFASAGDVVTDAVATDIDRTLKDLIQKTTHELPRRLRLPRLAHG